MGITRRKWFRRGRALMDFTIAVLSVPIVALLHALYRLAVVALRLAGMGAKHLLNCKTARAAKPSATVRQPVAKRRAEQARAIGADNTEVTYKPSSRARDTAGAASARIGDRAWRPPSPSREEPAAPLQQGPAPDESCRLLARDVLIQAGYKTREAEAAIAHVIKAKPDLNTPTEIVQAAFCMRGMRTRPNTRT